MTPAPMTITSKWWGLLIGTWAHDAKSKMENALAARDR
jgi:hypothetical protein